jgi:hypothetical protein
VTSPGFEDGNLIVLDRLIIDRRLRGHEIGLHVICRTLLTLGHNAVAAALSAVPLTDDGKPNRDATPAQKARLARHYGTLGFRKRRGQDVWTLDLLGEPWVVAQERLGYETPDE